MQDSSVGAAVLIATIAVLFAVGFIVFWLRDRGRAREVSRDPQRTEPTASPDSRSREAREGAANEPPELRRERRH